MFVFCSRKSFTHAQDCMARGTRRSRPLGQMSAHQLAESRVPDTQPHTHTRVHSHTQSQLTPAHTGHPDTSTLTRTHTHGPALAHTSMLIHAVTRSHMHAHSNTHTCTHTHSHTFTRTLMHAHVHTHAHTRMHSHMCTHTPALIHMLTHTRTRGHPGRARFPPPKLTSARTGSSAGTTSLLGPWLQKGPAQGGGWGAEMGHSSPGPHGHRLSPCLSFLSPKSETRMPR